MRIDDTPAVPDERTDHAVAKGRDVSLHDEEWTQPREPHSGVGVVLETTYGPQQQPPLRPVLTVSRTRFCKLHDRGARAPAE